MDDGCVNNRTAVHDESCGIQPLFHVIEHLAGDVVLFQQVSEVQECRSIIRCPFDGEVDLQEALHGVAVVDCILDPLVRLSVIPLFIQHQLFTLIPPFFRKKINATMILKVSS